MKINIGYFLTRSANKYPNKTALVIQDQRFSFSHLNTRANKLAHALMNLGGKKGDKFAVLMFNCHQFVEAYYAVMKIGGVLVSLNGRLIGDELQYIINHSDAGFLIFGQDFIQTVDSIRAAIPNADKFITVGQNIPEWSSGYEEILEKGSEKEPDIDIDEYDDACILYTSGTTGRPKGALTTHRNIFLNAVNQIVDWDLKPDDIDLLPIPLFHAGGLGFIPRLGLLGNTIVLMESFEPRTFMELIQQEKITRTGIIPTMAKMVFDLPDFDIFDTSSIRSLLTGTMLLPTALRKLITKKFPNAGLYDTYGQTEATSTISVQKPKDGFRKIGSVGKPFFLTEVMIVDEKDREVPRGEVGEIIMKSPTIMKGYYKDPEATEQAIKGGWLYTGDMGKMDEEGYIYIVDRKKDMIISGGINIYSKEIEDVLYSHTKVAETAVIGVPDEKWGENVMAVIVPRGEESMTESEVVEFCKEKLASYKKPKFVAFIKQMPKNRLGKILKTELRGKYGGPLNKENA
jgi:acyl-CoA synthetase (AMP-forming)/AMP-acid ligase II